MPPSRDFAQLFAAAPLTDAQFAAVEWVAIAMNVTNRVSIPSHHFVKEQSFEQHRAESPGESL
ncbi:hypothetical protein NQ028_10670 [Corynebacterium phoceense]|uniref:hypothetical protein n=1 Tax=Corynebacterium phoceense TaxID=1686286 RepID=UPI00211C9281|nr:hypothetical protein [Corynebacterium phoceense]MCQ9341597.1 hypothetical protein [Corynebacterium phoceense]